MNRVDPHRRPSRRPSRRRAALALAVMPVLAALIAWPRSAGAAPPAAASAEVKQRAAALLDEGNRLFDRHQFDEALARFQEAYATFPSPKILVNMAETERELGLNATAIAHYEQFLSEEHPDPGSTIGRRVAERLEAARELVGRLRVESDPPGAAITVDGRSVGVAPIEVVLDPGAHDVKATLPDRADAAEYLTVARGRGESLHLELRAVVAPSPAPPAAEPVLAPRLEAPSQAPAPSLSTPAPEARAEPAAGEPLTSRWWFWAALGVVVAAGATTAAVVASRGSGFTPTGELGTTSTADWSKTGH